MSTKRITVTTLGCRLNQFESDALERLLREGGYAVADSDPTAPIHILNSCTITHQADREARQLIAQIRRATPRAHIVVTGCYATASAAEVAAIPGVDLVVGNGAKEQLVRHLDELASREPGAQAAVAVDSPHKRTLSTALPVAPNARRSRAYLKVQDGCDYRCSFCIVPTVRGKSRSLTPATLLSQVDELVTAGVPEIVLTGVHLGTYGRDLTPRTTLVDLLRAMLPRLGSARLRLSSLDPHEVSEPLIDLMAANPERLCPYLHLPVQSCDARILKLMRRAHTVEDLTDLIPRLVQAIPHIAIGSDVIVGFPQEDAAAFANTRHVLDRLPLAYMHVFSYSQRDGTAAATMEGQVPAAQIAQRSHALRRLSAQKRVAFARRFVGTTRTAVVHRQRHAKRDQLVAITDNYLKVFFDGSDAWCGQTVQLIVQDVDNDGSVRGALVHEAAAQVAGF